MGLIGAFLLFLVMSWTFQTQEILSTDDKVAEMTTLSKTEFEIIEGAFHDGLGTYAEIVLANEMVSRAKLTQPKFDLSRSKAKMVDAINRLPASHRSRETFRQEVRNIEIASKRGAEELFNKVKPATLALVRHVPTGYSNARAGDLILEFVDHPSVPVSVKTDKSGRVAIAEGQTHDVGGKWARRFLRVSPGELDQAILGLGFSSMPDLKSHYLNVARLVAHLLIQKLGLKQCEPTDFSRAQVSNLEAAKYLLKQLLLYKKGSDGSYVIILGRSRGDVRWESRLDAIDIDRLTVGRISFTPAIPRGRPICSTFGIRIDGRTIVTFQVKHRRGSHRGTVQQKEFLDITTRLEI
jgi:hypothetical protein